MDEGYLGVLEASDPLYDLLAQVIRELLRLSVERPVFDVYAVADNAIIFRYVERASGVDLACKFYGNRFGSGAATLAARRLRHEFACLQRVWRLGMDRPPYRVVRPLAADESINCVLVEEYASGPKLDSFLKAALHEGAEDALASRLDDLAGFLGTLHRLSETETELDGLSGQAYLSKVVGQLANLGVIGAERRRQLEELRDRWSAGASLGAGQRVLVHGDVTPVNIVFGRDHEVIAIDLERLREDDAAVDIGMVLAELRHAFYRTTHDPARAEPFVERFFRAYTAARRLDEAAACGLEVRCRFYAGAMMLRISRNDWLDIEYRRNLTTEAERWLASPGQRLFCSTSTTR